MSASSNYLLVLYRADQVAEAENKARLDDPRPGPAVGHSPWSQQQELLERGQ